MLRSHRAAVCAASTFARIARLVGGDVLDAPFARQTALISMKRSEEIGAINQADSEAYRRASVVRNYPRASHNDQRARTDSPRASSRVGEGSKGRGSPGAAMSLATRAGRRSRPAGGFTLSPFSSSPSRRGRRGQNERLSHEGKMPHKFPCDIFAKPLVIRRKI